MKPSPQSAGGKAMAIRQRKEALEKYYNSPNYCLYCNKIIQVPIGGKVNKTIRKKFCNSQCSNIYNNYLFPKRKKIDQHCKDCGKIFPGNKRTKRCPECQRIELQRVSCTMKKDASRGVIAGNARTILNKSSSTKKCSVCDYALHVEACHIKPVKEFNENSLLKEINSPKNLIYLCRNCHWELDHNVPTL